MFSSLSLGSVLTLINGLLSIADKITKYMQQKQLMDAGRAVQQKEDLKNAKDAVKKAINARRSARNNGVPDDYKHFR